jgi:hypothetical protein
VHAARPHDEVQACGKQHHQQHIDPENQNIRLTARQERRQRERDDHAGADRLERRGSRAQRLLGLGEASHHRLAPAEQPVWPYDQHDGHDQEFSNQGQLGEIERNAGDGRGADADAQRFDLGDDDGGEIGAGD